MGETYLLGAGDGERPRLAIFSDVVENSKYLKLKNDCSDSRSITVRKFEMNQEREL